MARLAEQSYELVDVEQLQPHPRNPRRHNDEAIQESVDENDFYGTVVVQKSTGFILAGHGRYRAAVNGGMPQVPVVWLDVDDTRALKILLADNRTNDQAGYDDSLLADLLKEQADAGDLLGTGYDNDAVEDLLASLGLTDIDAELDANYSEAPEKAETRKEEINGTKEAQGLREVVLVLPMDQYEVFRARIAELREELGTESTSQTVFQAVCG